MKLDRKKVLTDLRKALRGHYPTIARECGVTVGFVSHVLNDRMKSDKVMTKAIEVKDRLLQTEQEVLTKAAQGL